MTTSQVTITEDEENDHDDFKYSYTPTDLLKVYMSSTDLYQMWYSTIRAAVKDINKSMRFRSTVIKDYFKEISTPNTKRHIRLGLKFFLTFAMSMILLSPITDPANGVQNSLEAMGLICVSIIGYMFSMRQNSYFKYRVFSLVFILLSFSTSLLKYSNLYVSMEIHYTPTSQGMLLMFAILPVKFELSFCICCIFVVAYEGCTFNRLIFGTEFINNVKDEKYFEHESANKMYVLLTSPSQEAKVVQSYIKGQIMLWISCLFAGVYLHASSQLRRRASFLRLGENVKAQQQVRNAHNQQTECIGAIVPEQVKIDYMREKEANKLETLWLFSKAYDKVTILFADIVGFTRMSSNKTAPKVVTLLNDLFHRFDDLCLSTSCEKLGTLGDCYYCVAGCPTPRYDHAACCVEAGLGMCRIIQTFNMDYSEDVNMRVGVHTGRVNAAIIGNVRFRFDVYSYDVLIANTIESLGSPGRVHISEITHEQVVNLYSFQEGQGLSIKREVQYGESGLKLQMTNMKTYFVDPQSSRVLKKTLSTPITANNDPNARRGSFQIMNQTSTTRTSISGMSTDSKDRSCTANSSQQINDDNSTDEIIDEDIRFINTLRRDPDKQIELFETLPIWPFRLSFMDQEVEYHYHAHTRDEIRPIYVDSVKLAPLADCVASMIFTACITLACYFFAYEKFIEQSYYVLLVFSAGISNTMLVIWSSLKIAPLIDSKFFRSIFLTISHPAFKNMQSILMCGIPCFICLLMFDCKLFHKDHMYTSFFFSVSFFSLFGHAIYMSSFAWVNTLSSVMFVALFLFFFNGHPECVADKCYNYKECETYTCRDMYKIHFFQFWESYILPICIAYILNLFVIFLINRENDKTLRLCFFVTREAQICAEEADKALIDSREMLHNIIPQYALEQIIDCGGDIRTGNFSYAVNVPNASVMFACISNFFSSYYREDYKGGKGGLQLLNKIICGFDEILVMPQFAFVEKIKTINDCYMVASGLNIEQIVRSKDPRKHLCDLLYYCFSIQKVLSEFNEQFVFGSTKFEMKIGYNIGPVTAGIIGTTKPLYDIWGDTVNVASRMYSTGIPGRIQVIEHVTLLLEESFRFIYQGIVEVKGKASMIGAGVYVTSGVVANKKAGPAVILSYLLAGITAFLNAICYAELSSRIPKAGSAYTYTYVAGGEMIAFVVGWSVILEYILSAASVASGFSSMLNSLTGGIIANGTITYIGSFPDSNYMGPYPDFIAFLLVMLLCLITVGGARTSSIFNIIITTCNVLILVALTIFLFVHAKPETFAPKELGGFMPFGLSGVVAGAGTCFFTFIGFDAISICSEEAKNPKRSLPLAISIAVIVVLVLLVLTSLGLVLFEPWFLVTTTAPFMDSMRRQGFMTAMYAAGVGGMISASSSLFAAIVAMPKVVYAMAQDGLLFETLGYVYPKTQVPIISLTVCCLISALLSMIFDMTILADFLSIGTLFAFSVVTIVLILLRWRTDEEEGVPKKGDQETVSELSQNEDCSTSNGGQPYGGLRDRLVNSPFFAYLDRPPRMLLPKIFLSLYVIFTIGLSAVIFLGPKHLNQTSWWAILLVTLFTVGMVTSLVIISLFKMRTDEDTFQVPLVPFIPCVTLLLNIILILKLNWLTWIRFIAWTVIGLIIYFAYGIWHSKLRPQSEDNLPLISAEDELLNKTSSDHQSRSVGGVYSSLDDHETRE